MLKLTPPPSERPLRKLDIAIPQLNIGISTPPVISPDGKKFAYVAGQSLWVREFDSLTPRELVKGNSPQYFFWSPDSNYLAYMADQKIWKLPVIGGQPSVVAAATFGLGAYTPAGLWTEDGRIIFAPSAAGSELLVVPVEGGEFIRLIERDSKTESDFHKPSALPDNKGILFVVDHFDGGPDEIDVLAGNVRKTVLRLKGAQLESPVYSPTGHILYRREIGAQGIWALPFSLEKLEPTGEPFLVSARGAWPSVSSDGTLLFVPEEVGLRFQLAWLDPAGKILEALPDTDMQIWHPRISPDGSRVAFVAGARGRGAVYILDLKRRSQSRLTLGDGQFEFPSWSADGRVVYFDLSFSAQMIMEQVADGNSSPREVVHGFHASTSQDGKYLFFEATKEGLAANICYLPLAGDAREAIPFIELPLQQRGPQPSPDGQFVAYYSNESGQNEVYVKDFPKGTGKWQVSTNGGTDPLWSKKGDRIFYVNGEEFLEVKVSSRTPFTLGTPRVLFSGAVAHLMRGRGFDVSADGNRFLTVQQAESSTSSTPLLTVVENWFAEFKEKQKK
jgi:Tol biopolymer transport system component